MLLAATNGLPARRHHKRSTAFVVCTKERLNCSGKGRQPRTVDACRAPDEQTTPFSQFNGAVYRSPAEHARLTTRCPSTSTDDVHFRQFEKLIFIEALLIADGCRCYPSGLR